MAGKHSAEPGQRTAQGHEATQADVAKRGWIKLAVSLVASFVVTMATAALLIVGLVPFPDNPILGAAAGRMAAGLVAVVAFALLGGRSWLKVTGAGLAYTFRRAWMLLLIGAVPGGITIFQAMTSGGLPADLLPNLALIALLCISIGVLEETLFRGIDLNGLLAGLGGWRWGVLASVMVAAVMFGRVHVAQENVTGTVAAAQAALKIVQTAMFGIVLSETCMHTRELGSAVLFHALNDFLMMSVSMGVQGNTTVGSYINTDQTTAVYLAYGIMIAVSLWPTIQALRAIWNEHQVDRGAFME